MLFAVWATDRAGTLAARLQARPQHRQRLRSPAGHAVVVRLAGPTLDDGGQMNGSLLVVEAASAEAVRRFVDEDPYSLDGVYGAVEIRPFACGMGPLAPQAAADGNAQGETLLPSGGPSA
ncbi:MAG: YciI family protein [Rubrivivax sp.]|nr:YciI family protein [Rubrivivax sp.]